MENRCAYCLSANQGSCGQAAELRVQAQFNQAPPPGVRQMTPDAWANYRERQQQLINTGKCALPDQLIAALAETPEVLPNIT